MCGSRPLSKTEFSATNSRPTAGRASLFGLLMHLERRCIVPFLRFPSPWAQDDQHGQIRYNRNMKTVNISDLKAQLSAHIQFVKDGEEVLVCDRNKPVARIVPCGLDNRSAQEQRLVARGVLVPPLKKKPSSWPEPPGDVSDKVIERVWREEREGR